MSLPLLLGCFWVIAATVTALMPMRRQMFPGIALLVSAPVLLVWLGVEHGWMWVIIGLAVFGSMFRRPLWGIYQYARGRPIPYPRDIDSPKSEDRAA